MKKIATHLLPLFVLPLVAGCGGSAAWGRNSEVEIRLESYNGSNTNDFAMAVVPNEGSFNSPNAGSDNQPQDWITRSFSTNLKRFTFRTASFRVPYAFYVRNVNGVNAPVRLRIRVDDEEKVLVILNPPTNGTAVKYATIFRNNVQD